MGTLRGQMIGVLVGALDSPADTVDFSTALAVLVSPVQNIVFSPYTFHYISPHRSATLAGRRAGSPVSVSLWYRLCAVDDNGRHLSMINRNEFRKSVRQTLSSCLKDMGPAGCNFRYNHLEINFERKIHELIWLGLGSRC
jgi:hypothetical protein